MDEIDKLLAHLAPEPKKPQPQQPKADAPKRSSQGSIDDLLDQLNEPRSIQSAPSSNVSSFSAPANDRLIDNLKAEHEEQQVQQQAQQEFERQEQKRQKQQRLEKLKQQRREQLKAQAAEWLKTLDPKSYEGKWFEEFSCNYASPLEAAIEYLEALKEVSPDQK